ncbi:MAG: reverse transcriptase-like protein, partial [Chitinophagaceae bacterium]
MNGITIYTDGSSRGNPGPGGYGVVLMSGPHKKELSGGFRLTTNNRMELMAVIVGLEAITKKELPVTIYSDSQYVVNAISKGWLNTWIKTNFKGDKKNPDLWKRFYQLSHS